MKIFYYNDTEDCQMLHKNDCFGDNMKYTAPLEGVQFDVPLKEGDGIMIKQWNGRILITRIDANAFEDTKGRITDIKTDSETCGNCKCRVK